MAAMVSVWYFIMALPPRPRAPLVAVRDRQLFRGEQRNHHAALVGHHDLLLDARGGESVLGRAIGFEREYHAGLDLHRVLERNHARDDRPLVQREPEPVAELQPEGGELAGDAAFLRPAPDARP